MTPPPALPSSAALFLLAAALSVPAPRAGAAEGTPPPLRVAFELPEEPQETGEPAALTLEVTADPGGLPPGAAAPGSGVEMLLRLPPGVDVVSPGWLGTPLPPEEKGDTTGPWRLFKKAAIPVPQGDPQGVLFREPLVLKVTEDGLNWVVTVRAELTSAAGRWKAFGTVFATRRDGKAEFHASPRRE